MIITFGTKHHAQDATPLRDRYVVVEDRKEAFLYFGAAWAFDYADAESAGVFEYHLQEYKVPLDHWLAHDIEAHYASTECSACSRLDEYGVRMPNTGIVAV